MSRQCKNPATTQCSRLSPPNLEPCWKEPEVYTRYSCSTARFIVPRYLHHALFCEILIFSIRQRHKFLDGRIFVRIVWISQSFWSFASKPEKSAWLFFFGLLIWSLAVPLTLVWRRLIASETSKVDLGDLDSVRAIWDIRPSPDVPDFGKSILLALNPHSRRRCILTSIVTVGIDSPLRLFI